MGRQERNRQEHVGSNVREGAVPCTHTDLYVYAQQEAAGHSAIAANEAMHIKEWDNEMIMEARKNGANGAVELRERWYADRFQAEINPQMKTPDLWDERHHPNPPQRLIDFLDHDQ